uniref:HMA domain-containing protein n=1 Tax=Oryza meridionalis TaxID=40149 RepID=A0A0E0DDH9_9ORYZ
MPTLIITVDLQCCRCNIKIQKVLCCMQERGELEIEKIVYEKDTVVVSGPFDAEKLSCKLWCKAGKIIKDIKIKPPEEKKKKPEPKPDEKKPDPKPKPDPCKLIPFPYPYVYPPQCWPCGGCATPHCECTSKPPPAPAKPACGCPAWSSSCQYSHPPYLPPPAMPPYPPVLVCDEGPQYGACAVM